MEKLGEKIAKDCLTFVISQFICKLHPTRVAQQPVVKAYELETLDKTVEEARRVIYFIYLFYNNFICVQLEE